MAEAAETLGLRHVVVTSVDRDDLPDGGAGAFAETIAELRRLLPGASVEVLIPDFGGNLSALRTVFEARPDVLNHNIETVERLYRTVRPQARYERSLGVLRQAAEAGLAAKSGLMLGLGERRAEVEEALRDLLRAGCSMVTIGQYLRPSARHHPVVRFAPPEEFDHWREFGLGLGFARVESAPLVRSSFHAALTYQASLSKKDGGR
ncbi:MAG: Lipoyl synthase [candidate division BRC1 bacterium ADurb.BinA364]|nr:MAG: Lipoyl synthase [candidate division BRC1 bacterium ADurb.BinA364]